MDIRVKKGIIHPNVVELSCTEDSTQFPTPKSTPNPPTTPTKTSTISAQFPSPTPPCLKATPKNTPKTTTHILKSAKMEEYEEICYPQPPPISLTSIKDVESSLHVQPAAAMLSLCKNH